MTGKAALLVSHGQPSAPELGEAELAALGAQVAGHLPDWTLRTATLAGNGTLELALHELPSNPVVYPMFMSEGWFTQVQLVKRLGGSPARITRPFGLDPHLPDLAVTLLRERLVAQGWQAEQTQLFVSGHGSGRSAGPARDTFRFADALASRLPFLEIRVGLVEEPPRLAAAARGLGAQAISLPFFAARRGHVLEDLPEALDATGFAGLRLDPIGCAPGVPKQIAQALLAH